MRLTNRPRLRTLPPSHSYENQRLQRQFGGLLMMGIEMSETCWAVSVRQSNKFYDWFLHPVGCFIWGSSSCAVNWKWKQSTRVVFVKLLKEFPAFCGMICIITRNISFHQASRTQQKIFLLIYFHIPLQSKHVSGLCIRFTYTLTLGQ
jgi:hypothetical protein